MLIILNNTDAFFAPLQQDDPFLGKHVDFVVKCTFTLAEDGTLTSLPQKEQPWPQGDIGYQDDLGNSIRYPADIGPPRPYTDLIVTGHAWQPDGRREERLEVGIALGQWSKRLVVFGDRYWRDNALGERVMTAPDTFTSMPIRYELAFGGLMDWRNPMGRGMEPLPGRPADDPLIPLPNIEHPDQLIRDPDDRPPPAGFGPIPQSWEPRASRHGTRDQRWALFHAPRPPKDQDPRVWNAAPDDQMLPLLAGNETLFLSNLHPRRRVLEVTLPGLLPRVFFVERADKSRSLQEVPVQLDLVHVDTDRMLVTLVWRQRLAHEWNFTPEALLYNWVVWNKVGAAEPGETLQAQFAAETRMHEEALEIVNMGPAEMARRMDPIATQELVKSLEQVKAPADLIARVTSARSPEDRLQVLLDAVRRQADEVQRIADDIISRHGPLPPNHPTFR